MGGLPQVKGPGARAPGPPSGASPLTRGPAPPCPEEPGEARGKILKSNLLFSDTPDNASEDDPAVRDNEKDHHNLSKHPGETSSHQNALKRLFLPLHAILLSLGIAPFSHLLKHSLKIPFKIPFKNFILKTPFKNSIDSLTFLSNFFPVLIGLSTTPSIASLILEQGGAPCQDTARGGLPRTNPVKKEENGAKGK